MDKLLKKLGLIRRKYYNNILYRCTEAEDRYYKEKARVVKLESVLRDIEIKGHTDYHARGYSLADIAGEGLKK